jgi:hypothetical protein
MSKLQQIKRKAFTSHKPNGVYLKFENGNSLSTIWGVGTYSDNYDREFTKYDDRILEGSNLVEIMPNCSEKMKKKLKKVCGFDGTVAGYLTMEKWLKVVSLLANEKVNHE